MSLFFFKKDLCQYFFKFQRFLRAMVELCVLSLRPPKGGGAHLTTTSFESCKEKEGEKEGGF
jgi:hypothetical protein